MSKMDDLSKNLDPAEKRSALRSLVGIINKLIRYGKGGLSRDERADLAQDLTVLAGQLLVDAVDPA